MSSKRPKSISLNSNAVNAHNLAKITSSEHFEKIDAGLSSDFHASGIKFAEEQDDDFKDERYSRPEYAPLRESISDFNKSSIYGMDPNVQLILAKEIQKARNGAPIGTVLNNPLDLSSIVNKKIQYDPTASVAKETQPNYNGTGEYTIGQIAPALLTIGTVKDAQDVLMRSLIPAISYASLPSGVRKGGVSGAVSDFIESSSVLFTAVLEKLQVYDPSRGSVPDFMRGVVLATTKSQSRAEQTQRFMTRSLEMELDINGGFVSAAGLTTTNDILGAPVSDGIFEEAGITLQSAASNIDKLARAGGYVADRTSSNLLSKFMNPSGVLTRAGAKALGNGVRAGDMVVAGWDAIMNPHVSASLKSDVATLIESGGTTELLMMNKKGIEYSVPLSRNVKLGLGINEFLPTINKPYTCLTLDDYRRSLTPNVGFITPVEAIGNTIEQFDAMVSGVQAGTDYITSKTTIVSALPGEIDALKQEINSIDKKIGNETLSGRTVNELNKRREAIVSEITARTKAASSSSLDRQYKTLEPTNSENYETVFRWIQDREKAEAKYASGNGSKAYRARQLVKVNAHGTKAQLEKLLENYRPSDRPKLTYKEAAEWAKSSEYSIAVETPDEFSSAGENARIDAAHEQSLRQLKAGNPSLDMTTRAVSEGLRKGTKARTMAGSMNPAEIRNSRAIFKATGLLGDTTRNMSDEEFAQMIGNTQVDEALSGAVQSSGAGGQPPVVDLPVALSDDDPEEPNEAKRVIEDRGSINSKVQASEEAVAQAPKELSQKEISEALNYYQMKERSISFAEAQVKSAAQENIKKTGTSTYDIKTGSVLKGLQMQKGVAGNLGKSAYMNSSLLTQWGADYSPHSTNFEDAMTERFNGVANSNVTGPKLIEMIKDRFAKVLDPKQIKQMAEGIVDYRKNGPTEEDISRGADPDAPGYEYRVNKLSPMSSIAVNSEWRQAFNDKALPRGFIGPLQPGQFRGDRIGWNTNNERGWLSLKSFDRDDRSNADTIHSIAQRHFDYLPAEQRDRLTQSAGTIADARARGDEMPGIMGETVRSLRDSHISSKQQYLYDKEQSSGRSYGAIENAMRRQAGKEETPFKFKDASLGSYDSAHPELNTEHANEVANMSKGWAQKALSKATSTPAPLDPQSQMASYQKRAFTEIGQMSKALEKELISNGMPAEAAKNLAQEAEQFQKAAYKTLTNAVGKYAADVSANLPGASSSMYNAQGVHSIQGLRQMMRENPNLENWMNKNKFTPEGLMDAKEGDAVIYSGKTSRGNASNLAIWGRKNDDSQFEDETANWNRGPGGQGPQENARMGGGVWSGKLGGFLYSAYIAKRIWSMGAGPEMQNSAKYAQGLSSLAGNSMYGTDGEGLLGTDAGAEFRQQKSASYWNKGAYENFGLFQDIGYYAQGGSGDLARVVSGAKMAGSIAGISVIAPKMLPVLTGGAINLSAGGAAAVTTAGAVAGGAILGTVLAANAVNHFGHASGAIPEWDNFTVSSAAKEAFISGPSYTNMGLKMAASVRDYASSNSVSPHEAMVALGGSERMASSFDRLSDERGTGWVAYGNQLSAWASQNKYSMTDSERGFIGDFANSSEAAKTGILATNERIANAKALSGFVTGEEGEKSKTVGLLQQVYGDDLDREKVSFFDAKALGNNMAPSAHIGASMSYASALGAMPDTNEYRQLMEGYVAGTSGNLGEQVRKDYFAQRVSASGSQLQSQMGFGGDMAGLGSRLVSGFGLQTQQQVGAVSSLASAAQSGGGVLSSNQWTEMADAANRMGVIQSGMFASGVGSSLAFAGASPAQITQAAGSFASMGLSNQQMSNYSTAASGSRQAMSFVARQQGDAANLWFDASGNNISETSGVGLAGLIQGQGSIYTPSVAIPTSEVTVGAGSGTSFGPGQKVTVGGGFTTATGNPVAAKLLAAAGGAGASSREISRAYLGGTKDEGLLDAFMAGGSRGMAAENSERNYKSSMASAGIAIAGTRLTQAFNWGTGSYTNPSAGSSWAIEDQKIANANASQLADFSASAQRMEMSNTYSVANENISQQRMSTGNNYNNWSQAASYNQSLMQRGYTQEDNQYSDQMRSLSFGWAMEDADRNIRFSSGRDRQQAVRQKDRAVITQNLEDEQIDKTRERQTAAWALEDERYKKTREYTLDLQALDKKSFDLSRTQREQGYQLDKTEQARKVAEYKASYKLDEELRILQRKLQKEQLDLQIQSAGVSAEAAENQRNYELATIGAANNEKDMIGYWEQMNSFDKAYANIQAMTLLMNSADSVNSTKIASLLSIFRALSSSAGNIHLIQDTP